MKGRHEALAGPFLVINMRMDQVQTQATAAIRRAVSAVEQSSVACSEVQEGRTVLRNDVASVGALRNG